MNRYSIGDIVFEIDYNYEFEEEDAFIDFKHQTGNTVERYKFIPYKDEKYNLLKEKILYDSNLLKVYKTDKGIVREYIDMYKKRPYAYLLENRIKGENIIYHDLNRTYLTSNMFSIMELMGIELALSREKSFMFHSSYIKHNNEAILFSGPSGIGKSTQASLWEKLENAEIINGDRSIIKKKNKKWHAYGLPFSGSSKIYKDITAPIKAIVILRKSKENNIKKLSRSEAFKLIYSETTVNIWNKDFVDTVISTIIDLIEDIPVYMLNCTPDKNAVELLKKELGGNFNDELRNN